MSAARAAKIKPPQSPIADGFRKIPLIGADGSSDQRMDVAQFYHMNFMRDQEQRLSNIKRKVSWLAALISLLRACPSQLTPLTVAARD